MSDITTKVEDGTTSVNEEHNNTLDETCPLSSEEVIEKSKVSPISFPVYIIFSRWSLPEIDSFLKDYGEAGFLRVVYDNSGKETDRTLAILPDDVYQSLCNNGYGESNDKRSGRGFCIKPFVLRDNSFPPAGRSEVLFVPLPKQTEYEKSFIVDTVNDKLTHLSEWDIIPDNSWNINVPLQSREKGGVKNGCFVSFNKDVSLARISMVRNLLNDTYWPNENVDENRPIFQCFWARVRKQRVPNKDNTPQNNSPKSKEQRFIYKQVSKAKPVTVQPLPSTKQPMIK